MPPIRWDLRIRDVVASIEKIQQSTIGMDLKGLLNDSKTIDAVIRNLEFIGEAARRVPREVVNKHPNTP